jgi:uncharacterized membrane protein
VRSYSSTTIVAPPVVVGGGFGYSPFGFGGFGMPFFAPVPFFGGGLFQLFFFLMIAGVVANVVRGIVSGMSSGGRKEKGPGANDSWDEL